MRGMCIDRRGDTIRPMTIKVLIRSNDQLLRTFTFTHTTSVPVPEVGESVINPKDDTQSLHVDRREFEYGTDRMKITLFCTAMGAAKKALSFQ